MKVKTGFTLLELLVVIGMIAVILGALSTSFASARARARVQKATAEVKIISQAILAYENWDRSHKLQPMNRQDADSSTLGFLLGSETAQSGGKIPVMLMAQLQKGGKVLDPWGNPYKITIKQGVIPRAEIMTLSTGYFLPNSYRVWTGGAQ